jgi:DMSO/TMAO reductase YedYZ molybdopterin-dependent catalytic subunit
MSAPAIVPPVSTDKQVEMQVRRMTRRGFATGAVASMAGLAAWSWVKTRDTDNGIPWPLRRVLQWNEKVARAYSRPSRLAPTFAPNAARMPRANGQIGLGGVFDPAAWSLRIESPVAKKPVQLTLDEIRALPRVEMVTELKCIEGWSDPVRWTGARLADLAGKIGLASRTGREADLFSYANLSTPDDAYYVGLDIESALHPQTLLCYEMNGLPLTLEHGAPLRLAIPVKYGIKNIKRIGTIRFTDRRPADYWAERGYDWYAGH